MRANRPGWTAAVAMLLLVLPALAGCRISEGNGDHKDMSIDTPLGGLKVKTDPGAVLAKVGLPAYPGAQPVAETADDKHSADVNFSIGSFKVQVLATALETSDSPAQVEAFYRKALAQYSDVIACRGNRPVGTPTRTGMGLTCDDDKHGKTIHGKTYDHEDGLELKAGSSSRQHVVALDEKSGKTHIELVSLELPHGMGDDD